MYVFLLGATPAQSYQNLVRWLDQVVQSKAGADSLVYDHGNNKIHGKYIGLRPNELAKIESVLSSLDQWAFECVQQRISCRRFVTTTCGGRGGTSNEVILVGPFQKVY